MMRPRCPAPVGLKGARLNFAENLLRYRDDRLALVFRGEDRVRRTYTYAQLYDEVARVARALKDAGVTAGDRVAGFVPNMPESIIAMLAATSLGRPGRPARRISASRACWTASARSNPRCSSPPTAIFSRESPLTPWRESQTSSARFHPWKNWS
jgi:acyl-coenzyme A synthetase/AMP-(fatty) acid ligase